MENVRNFALKMSVVVLAVFMGVAALTPSLAHAIQSALG
jgi:hypothetical protein